MSKMKNNANKYKLMEVENKSCVYEYDIYVEK